MFIKIITAIIALAMSDVYMIIFKKILEIYEKRQNAIRKRSTDSGNGFYPPIKYRKEFKNTCNGVIIVSVILGCLYGISIAEEDTFLALLRVQVLGGISALSIISCGMFIFFKIKSIYCDIKYNDPQFTIREIPDIEEEKTED